MYAEFDTVFREENQIESNFTSKFGSMFNRINALMTSMTYKDTFQDRRA